MRPFLGTCPSFTRLTRSYHAVKRSAPYLTVHTIPCFDDNYVYLLDDEANKDLYLVDPGEAAPVLLNSIARIVEEALNEHVAANASELRAILTTHKHWDHVGGNVQITKAYPGIQVVGPAKEAAEIPALTHAVHDGDIVGLGDGNVQVEVLHTGCHTAGHVSFFIQAMSDCPPLLFSGDTLFVGGCGRFFEGTAQDMYNALYDKIAPLPDETVVYSGHEYTLSNLRFALSIEPNNSELRDKSMWAEEQRNKGVPTVPSTLKEEKAYNPFLRCHETSIQEAVGLDDPVEVLAELRRRKDNF